MKRIFDFIISLFSLVILFPLLVAIGLIIKINDNGPIIFKQRRVGQYGRTFLIYKFRTMHLIESSKVEDFEPGDISRITSIGKFLRKKKLDELPQLLNVLIGNMSFVGPRPEVEKWIKVYPDRWERVLSVKPGITDNASVLYRNEESLLAASKNPEITYKEIVLPKKLELYESYVLHHSFYGDLKLIFKTLFNI